MIRACPWGAGLATAAIVAAVLASLVPMVAYAISSGGQFGFDRYVWGVLGFTLWQAALSTFVSMVLALPASLALAQRRFRGRETILALFSIPQALPAIVVVLALTGVFGKAGVIPELVTLYGVQGIVLAHVFFNAPLLIRLFVEALECLAPETRHLADQLGLSGLARFRHVEWPVLMRVIPRALALVFLLCAASFVVVLTFGGPGATTLEVAIYQSLRMDLDVSRAISLATLQIALCVALMWLSGSVAPMIKAPAPVHLPGARQSPRLVDLLGLALPLLVVVPPLLVLIGGAVNLDLRPALLQALATSAALATMSTVMALVLAWPLAAGMARHGQLRGILNTTATLGLIVPPAVLATGWFLLLRGVSGHVALSFVLVASLNGLMALPFATAILNAAMGPVLPQHDRLCAGLALTGWSRFRLIDGPALRRPLLQAALLCFVMSLGDLTGVMMLGAQGLLTLPALIAAEMGNYRSASAQGTAFLLAALCFIFTLVANRVGRPT
jgi:thiamine transport system permease protein